MNDLYNTSTAKHYQAYRPSLHQNILKSVFRKSKIFDQVLDVGCGVGHSSVALLEYGRNITGLEISAAMLEKAKTHKNIQYICGSLTQYPLPSSHYDLITFAGSLFYAKSQALLNEVMRISKEEAIILVYDFQLDLSPILSKLNLILPESNYEHDTDFSDLQASFLHLRETYVSPTSFICSPSEIIHVLFAEKPIASAINQKYPKSGEFQYHWNQLFGEEDLKLRAELNYNKYLVLKRPKSQSPNH
ncbi:class I SAM-dependent methyltransferase [Membranihabitans marinus]|uniref:class I SAM-dependent methyltransferase n=1 Tax=Membranihabitans marinus TaxID=1227546 RepID=UPI001F369656|nr:class I SAM-dependent methyltransferase [Membranihabitans marinus]